jgi:hypothetical protein
MASIKTTWLIAAALPMSLAACVSVSPPNVVDEASLGRICPMPTPPDRLEAIAEYLDTAQPSRGLDVLATEWERLDEGVRKARSR